MKRTLLSFALVAAAMTFAGKVQAQTMFGLTSSNEIFSMTDANNPSSVSGPYSVSGITSGQVLVALDARAKDGGLYALGYNSTDGSAQLYRITGSGSTWAATSIGSALNLDLGNGSSVGFDFISSLENEIRITGMGGHSYSVNADNGQIMNSSTNNMSYASGDVNAALTAAIGATAYTNNYYGSDATEQYGYDLNNNVLVKFTNANYYNNNNNYPTTFTTANVLTSLILNVGSSVGMDSWYDSSNHNNTLWLSATPLLATGAHLYKMDNTTGLPLDMGAVGNGTLNVRDIAWENGRDTSAANSSLQGSLMAALTLNLRNLIFFDSYRPNYIRRMVHLSGMTSGQAMLAVAYGMDQRLYGLGYNGNNQTYQLYTIDTLSGMVSVVNNTAGSMNLGNDNSSYGNGGNTNVAFNFIGDATNRIRVIGNNGQTNLQLDAVNGLVVETDSAISYMNGDSNYGQTANIGSIGYLNSYNGSNSSQMIGFDFNTGAMVTLSGNSANGYNDLMTTLSLNGILNIFGGNNSGNYRNGYLDILFDNTTSTNIGYMASNYYGDSSASNNYSSFYTMNNMSSTSNLGTASQIGGGTPVKSIAAKKQSRTTGVNTVAAGNYTQLFAYPNPTNNNARIVLSAPSVSKVYVTLMDLDGRTIRSYEFPSGTARMDISLFDMPVGVYSAHVFQQGIADQSVKIVKN